MQDDFRDQNGKVFIKRLLASLTNAQRVEAMVAVAFMLALVGLSMPAMSAIVAAMKRRSEPAVLRPYTIRLTRPDGRTHHTYTIESVVEPKVVIYPKEHGCLRVWSRRVDRESYTQPFPVGWLVEVEPKVEEEQ